MLRQALTSGCRNDFALPDILCTRHRNPADGLDVRHREASEHFLRHRLVVLGLGLLKFLGETLETVCAKLLDLRGDACTLVAFQLFLERGRRLGTDDNAMRVDEVTAGYWLVKPVG